MTNDPLAELPAGAFSKQDPGDDLAFYAPPRLVTHIDEGAVAALTACYRERLPKNSQVLDLMSSWVSHLPSDRTYAAVVGHGMNAEELAANPRLDRWFVQDLNRKTSLPLADQSFDAALCCVGAQYLQQPVAVFAAVRRVLTPDAPFIVSFSNRCFPTKAVAIWRSLDTNGHAALLRLYLERAASAVSRPNGSPMVVRATPWRRSSAGPDYQKRLPGMPLNGPTRSEVIQPP